jgi:hypothetical protein
MRGGHLLGKPGEGGGPVYLRWLFYAIAVVDVLYGLGFLLIPETVASAYGASGMNPTTITIGRYWGATLVPLGYLAWIAATTGGSALKLHFTRAAEFIAIIGFIVTVLAMSAGVISTAGGILNLVLTAVFTIGFGYYGWAKTAAATT